MIGILIGSSRTGAVLLRNNLGRLADLDLFVVAEVVLFGTIFSTGFSGTSFGSLGPRAPSTDNVVDLSVTEDSERGLWM